MKASMALMSWTSAQMRIQLSHTLVFGWGEQQWIDIWEGQACQSFCPSIQRQHEQMARITDIHWAVATCYIASKI